MRTVLLTTLFLTIFCTAKAQENLNPPEDEYQVFFWNVENLFDTYKDSLKNDDEFLPYGIRGWSRERYQRKLFHIYKTIVAAGQWKLPEIIALAEVENKKVLTDLLEQTPLLRVGYQIIHQESEDNRGIDLAVLYKADRVQLVDTAFIRLAFPGNVYKKSRDIIYLQLAIEEKANFHLFVNHWPSRYGGGKASEYGRMYAAEVVREKIDDLLEQDSSANIIITGDFNDTPADPSLQILAGKHNDLKIISNQDFEGTHKHQGIWSHFDQLWVSEHLLEGATLQIKDQKAEVFHPEWLLENDKTYGGMKPNRTYEGYRYHGGFSDHLPVFIKLKMKPEFMAGKEK